MQGTRCKDFLGKTLPQCKVCLSVVDLGPVRLPTCILNLPHKIEMRFETFGFSARGHRSAHLLELAI